MENLDQEKEVLTDKEIFEETKEEVKKKESSPKIALFLIVIISVVGLFFSVNGWLNSLKVPFAKEGDIQELNANFNLAENDVANLLELQQKDTDLDGLSDYDELYLYQTSPYLPDSDSDGFTDFDEIQNNYDPNCPTGQDCSLLLPGDQITELPGLEADLTPAEIRLLLIQSGFSEDDVNALDDETLSQLYAETVQEVEGSSGNFQELQPENYNLITPDQLRSLLLQEGFNKDDLDNLTDQDLLDVWGEVLKSEMQTES